MQEKTFGKPVPIPKRWDEGPPHKGDCQKTQVASRATQYVNTKGVSIDWTPSKKCTALKKRTCLSQGDCCVSWQGRWKRGAGRARTGLPYPHPRHFPLGEAGFSGWSTPVSASFPAPLTAPTPLRCFQDVQILNLGPASERPQTKTGDIQPSSCARPGDELAGCHQVAPLGPQSQKALS